MRDRRRVFGVGVSAMLLAFGVAHTESATGKTETTSATKAQSGVLDVRLKDDLLRTKGQRVAIRRGVVLTVGEGTTVTPKFTSNLPVGPRGAKVPVETVDVDGGRVDAKIPESDVPRGVLLQGPDKILGISTGGHLTMIVEKDTIIVAAVEGDALLGQASKFKPLSSGMMRVFPRTGGMAKDVPLPAKASLSSNAGLSVALTGGVEVPLETDAEGPLRLVVTDALGSPMTAPRHVEAGAPLKVQIPRAGIYYAVVRALGEGGIGGPLSDPVKIQVLGLAPGQRPPVGGVFLLNRGERVRLAGTEGLEVRYGASPSYMPASNSVGLSRLRATVVEFRNPKSPDQKALLRLAPRYMKKEIELGPSGARWPGEPVKLRVGLWDGAGKLLKDGKDMDVRVTVNSDKVPVRWQSTQSGLVTSIPKQKGDGPWVVRVSVLDKRGKTIVRDFLEVAAR